MGDAHGTKPSLASENGTTALPGGGVVGKYVGTSLRDVQRLASRPPLKGTQERLPVKGPQRLLDARRAYRRPIVPVVAQVSFTWRFGGETSAGTGRNACVRVSGGHGGTIPLVSGVAASARPAT